MFRKFNLNKLSIAFAVLLLAVIITRVIDNSRGVNTLKGLLFNVDENEITELIIKPKMLSGEEISLIKEGNHWKVKKNGKVYNGDATTIDGLIKQINKLKPLRLAAKNKDKWEKFELTDSLSSYVQLRNNGKLLADLYIGKFSYLQAKQNPAMMQNPYSQRPQGTMTSYVRTGDDDEVYAVEGFLASSINRDVNAFRNKLIVKANKNDLSRITFNYPADSSFTMVKNEDKWMSDGIELDSASVAQYLSSISILKATDFTDNKPSLNFTHTITIQDNQMQTTEIKALLDNEDAIITSSQNKGTLFKEDKSRNFDKLFVSKNKLIQKL